MTTAAVTLYVVRGRPGKGLGLAEVVSRDDTQAVVRRLIGARFRMKTHRTATPVTVPAADVLREATAREIALGYPV